MAPPPGPRPRPRPPPYLMPELIGEIMVRFPPDDPACLVRASLVCKPWRRLLCDPAFRRRYAAFHRSPPLLGFLHNCSINSGGKYFAGPRFVSTTTPSPLPLQAFDDCNYDYGWRVLDCRHGRVLFKVTDDDDPDRHGRVRFEAIDDVSTNLAVWDIATGEQKHLLMPPLFPRRNPYSAAVLCAVRGCDHVHCHGGPFLVVFVGYNAVAMVMQSHLYSSETSTWSSSAFLDRRFVTVPKPSVLIGNNDIYFLLTARPSVAIAILNVDLGKNQISIINPPETHDFEGNAVLGATDDGLLGFAAILGSTLCLWSWSRNAMNSEVVGGWAGCRVIELQTLIPFKDIPRVVGFAEGSGIVFVASDVGVFSIDLKSGRERKVDEPREVFAIFPIISFYTPSIVLS